MIAKRVYKSLAAVPGEPIVLLHGWGFDANSMAPLVEPLRALGDVWCVDLPGFGDSASLDYQPEALAAQLAASLPARAVLIGWSLGGVVAVDYAARYPQRVVALATLATNTKFVAGDGWSAAMARSVNRAFNTGFKRDSAATLKHFCALVAQGSPEVRRRTRDMQQTLLQAPEGARAACWSSALEYLATRDLRPVLADMAAPTLHLYGGHDALVPAAAARALAAAVGAERVGTLAACGHALHWDQGAQVADRLLAFIRENRRSSLDKHWVALSFSRAAESYESAARLQRKVGEHLLSKLPSGAETVLDLGSGTGMFLGPLRQKTGAGQVLALDLAQGMLGYARSTGRPADAWVCADAESLPLAAGSLDLVFSSLAIQWCERLSLLACELHRTLRPGGQLCLATLGEGTLQELQAAWEAVDGYVHVNRFAPVQSLTDALADAGFTHIQLQRQHCVLYSDSLRALSAELKSLGAHNVNSGRPRGLTGRRRLAALEQAYEALRTEQGLPVSYQVVYVTATRGPL